MVNAIDIHKLNLEELAGVVDLYPWYGAARMELCRRMSEMGALSDSQLAVAALHIGSRRLLYNIVNAGNEVLHRRRRPEARGDLHPHQGR